MTETTEAPDIVRMLRDFCEMGLEGGDSDPLIEVMHSVASQAADEIERLRAEIVILENDVGWWRDGFQKVAPLLPAGK